MIMARNWSRSGWVDMTGTAEIRVCVRIVGRRFFEKIKQKVIWPGHTARNS